MTKWLFDTNTLSELQRPRPSAKVHAFVASQALVSLHVSTVTFAEIRYGIARLPELDKRVQLERWMTTTLRPMFNGRTLAVDEDVMVTWRELVESGRMARHTYPQPDLIIAATALRHGLTLVTRNVKDFAKTGIALHNPWSNGL